jgi:hypothetical protein
MRSNIHKASITMNINLWIWYHAVWLKLTNFSEVNIVCIFRVYIISTLDKGSSFLWDIGKFLPGFVMQNPSQHHFL